MIAKKHFRQIILGLIFLLFAWVMLPLIHAVFVGVIFSCSTYSFFQWALKRFPVSKNVLALGFTALFSVTALVSVSTLTFWSIDFGVNEVKQVKEESKNSKTISEASRWLDADFASWKISKWIPVDQKSLKKTFEESTQKALTGFTRFLQSMATSVPMLFLVLVLISVGYYAANRFGEDVSQYLLQESPFSQKVTSEVFNYIVSLSQFIIRSSIVAGVTQATIMVAVCLIAGVDQIFSIAVLVLFFSFIPFVGTAPVALIVILAEFLSGNLAASLIVGVGALIMGASDNVIRSYFLSRYEFMPTLLAFLSLVGGALALGPLGILTGPVVAGLAWKILQISQEKRQTVG